MAKQRENLETCLLTTIHHVDDHKVRLMVAADSFTSETVEYRFKLVRENLRGALGHLKKIRTAAEAGDSKKVLELLNESSIPSGHDQ